MIYIYEENGSVKRCRDGMHKIPSSDDIKVNVNLLSPVPTSTLQCKCSFYFLVSVLFFLLISVIVRPKPKKDILSSACVTTTTELETALTV